MKGRTAQKKILKTPTQPANKAKYSQKKAITLILFNYINFSILFFLSARRHKSCQHLSERGASHIVDRVTSARIEAAVRG